MTLTLDKRNARKHSEANRKAIRQSLAAAKAGRSIVLDAGDNVLAGNGVAEAWQELGGKVRVIETTGDELVAVKRTDLAPDSPEARQLATLDNLTADTSAHDYNLDLLREALENDPISKTIAEQDERLRALLKAPPKQETADAGELVDKAAELQAKWQVQRGDLWQCGKHRILCGDSTNAEDVARVMSGEIARMVWTDPPYGVKYGDKLEAANAMHYRVRHIENDNLSDEDLEHLINQALANASNHSLAGASIYVACHAGKPLPVLIRAFAGSGFEFMWHLVWVKDQIVLGRGDYHFKHENILYGWKHDAAHYFTEDRKQTSVFEYPRPKVSAEHPTMKPPELVAHMISNNSKIYEIVFDCFNGSGTTLVACEQTGRIGRGLEIEPRYVAVSLERLSNLGLTCERLSSG